MSQEPRDPALAAIVRATVRVAKGSGVVIRNGKAALIATAAHVVKGSEMHAVRRGAIFRECLVIDRNDDLDVAILEPPPELEAAAIAIADEAGEALAGDPIWAAGFPRGWNEPDPVLAPGTIAGRGAESWVNLDGTWGNSGGPLCQIADGSARLAGVLLGRAGDVNRRLEQFRNFATQEQLRAQATEESTPAGNVLVKLSLQGILANAALAREMSDLLEEHFRTGFLKFAPVSDLRKLLGAP